MTAEERSAYVRYRLQRAKQTLEEARVLLDAGMLPGAVNRVYYAMFYAASALALDHGFSTSSHGQLRGFFNREFVKTGQVPVELGKAYGAAFDSRTKGDYDDLIEFDTAQLELMLSEARGFVQSVESLLSAPEPEPGIS